MNTHCIVARPDLSMTEHRSPLGILREDSLFQGWGPRL